MQKFISLSYSWAENLRNPAVIKQVLLTFSVCYAVYQWNFNKRQFNLSDSAKNANACSFLWFKVTWYCTRPERATSQRKHSTTKYFLKKKEKKKPLSLSFHKQVSTWQSFSFFLSFLLLSFLLPWFGRGLFGFQKVVIYMTLAVFF